MKKKTKLFPVTNRHQSEMESQPDWHGKQRNDNQSVPGPQKFAGLDWKNHDHEIIAEPGVAEESSVARIATA